MSLNQSGEINLVNPGKVTFKTENKNKLKLQTLGYIAQHNLFE